MDSSARGATHAGEAASGRVLLAVMTVAGHAIKHMMNGAFLVLLPELKAGLGLSNTGIGTLSTFRNLAGGVVNIPAGFIADRFQGHGAMILGLSIIITGIFTALVGAAQSLPTAIAAAAIAGIAITFWHPTAISALSRSFPDRRGFAISLHGTGGSIGEALGPLAVGGLILFLGWRQVFPAIGVPGVVGGLLTWVLVSRVLSSKARATTSVSVYLASLRTLVSDWRLLSILAIVVGFGATQSAVFTFLPIYLQETLGYSAFRTKLYLAIPQTVGVGSSPAMGLVSDRWGRKPVLLLGLLALGASVLGIAGAPAGWALLAAMALTGVFLFPLMSILLAAAADIAMENVQATVVSLVFGVAILFSGLSPFISGLLADSYGVKAVFVYGAGISIATGLFLAPQRWPRIAAAPQG